METLDSVSLKPYGSESLSFLYEGGKPRLDSARSWFLGLRDMDMDGLRQFYRKWRDFDEFLVLQSQTWYGDKVERKTVAVKCSKRGNDVYKRRIDRRLGVFRDREHEFFKGSDERPRTSVLFFTLTYDIKLSSVEDAWMNVGKEFNRWITGLREKYGRISTFRTWESHENGYPHVHGMLIFHDSEFDAWKDVSPLHGDSVWRITDKPEFETWHSFVDIRAVRTMSAVVRYIGKRVLHGTEKNEDEEHGDLTLAMCWVFRKRSFSVSKDMAKTMSDLIRNLHNSKSQMSLEGGVLRVVWVLIGIFSASELGLDGSLWSVILENVPDG